MSGRGSAIVTGGARGIGFAVAERLAASGYVAVIVDTGAALRDEERDSSAVDAAVARIEACGGSAEGHLCDVRDQQAVQAVVADVAGRIGPVAVVVNSAGVLRTGPFLDETEERWRAVVSTHLGGHLNMIRALLPMMLEQGSGHIVNVTSSAALLGTPSHVAYSAAKEAIVGLTRYLGQHLGGTGVRVNAVAPGADTRMNLGFNMRVEGGVEAPAAFTDRDPACIARFVDWLVGDPRVANGGLYLVSGRYVAEYEHVKPWKWMPYDTNAGDSDMEVGIELALRRPHPTVIGPWPTRDFRLIERERQWEGASSLPGLIAAASIPAVTSLEPPAVLGSRGERTRSIGGGLSDLDPAYIEPVDAEAASARGVGRHGALAILPRASERPVLRYPDALVCDAEDVERICTDLVRMLAYLRWGIRTTGPRQRSSVTVCLPTTIPWLDAEQSLLDWLMWYGSVGAVRGGAATAAIYGVRVNGLVIGPGQEQAGVPALRYLLAEGREWLNGYVFHCEEDGLGLLADEQPRWQSFYGSSSTIVPDAFLSSDLGG